MLFDVILKFLKLELDLIFFQLEFLGTRISQLIKLAMITMTFKRHHINKSIMDYYFHYGYMPF
jgi:hypothetical protein